MGGIGIAALSLILICLGLLVLIGLIVLLWLEPLQQAVAISVVVGAFNVLAALLILFDGLPQAITERVPDATLDAAKIWCGLEGAVFLGLAVGISRRTEGAALVAAVLFTVGTVGGLVGGGMATIAVIVRLVFNAMMWRAYILLRGELGARREIEARRREFDLLQRMSQRPVPAAPEAPAAPVAAAPPPQVTTRSARVCPKCQRTSPPCERCAVCDVMFDGTAPADPANDAPQVAAALQPRLTSRSGRLVGKKEGGAAASPGMEPPRPALVRGTGRFELGAQRATPPIADPAIAVPAPRTPTPHDRGRQAFPPSEPLPPYKQPKVLGLAGGLLLVTSCLWFFPPPWIVTNGSDARLQAKRRGEVLVLVTRTIAGGIEWCKTVLKDPRVLDEDCIVYVDLISDGRQFSQGVALVGGWNVSVFKPDGTAAASFTPDAAGSSPCGPEELVAWIRHANGEGPAPTPAEAGR